MSLNKKVIFITGASRGIGLAIALRAAKDGACIAIAAKTQVANEKLPGTIFTAKEAIEAAGGKALAIACDVRDEEQVKAAIAKTVETFGGIDIVVNNAGAIQLTNTEQTDMKRFDLMQSINARAVYLTVKHALPYLKKSSNAHVLNLSPPLNLDTGWIAPHLAYTLSKYGMSLCTMGFAAEFQSDHIAVNSLWPETAIDTSAIRNLLGGAASAKGSRTTEIVADAAYWIFNQPAATCTGNFFIDSAVVTAAGEKDLSKYAVDPTGTLLPDFFLGKPPKTLPTKPKETEPKDNGTAPPAKPSAPPAPAAPAAPVAASAAPTNAPAAAPGAVTESKPAPTGSATPAVSAPPPETKPASKYSTLELTVKDHVATLAFNNPGRANAMGEAFWSEFPAAIKELIEGKQTRALIIYGHGNNFSSGIDLAFFKKLLADAQSTNAGKMASQIMEMQETFTLLTKAPFPVIAAIHGACLGAGLDLAAACDIRLGSRYAAFSIEEINIGIMADLGSLQRLPRIMPEGLVREMAFTGVKIDCDRALHSGLLNAVYADKTQLLFAAKQTARSIADKAPSAIRASKLALNYNQEQGLTTSLFIAAKLQMEAVDPAATAASLAKRKGSSQ